MLFLILNAEEDVYIEEDFPVIPFSLREVRGVFTGHWLLLSVNFANVIILHC